MITKDLTKAKELLRAGEYTNVLCLDENIHTSVQRGVKPLVVWLESKKDFKNYAAADKVVGKATAFLYLLLGVKAVYSQVISRSALHTLTRHEIHTEYDTLAENITNRQGNGICPFEAAVLDIQDAETAYKVIRQKMNELNISI